MRNNQTGIWQVPYLGGEPELIQFINSAGVNLKFWSNDGSTIYYELKRNIFALNVKTKQSTKITELDPERVLPYCVNISPDGQKIAFITVEKDNQYLLWLDSANGRSPRQLARLPGPGKRVVWHKDGNRILYSAYLDGYFQIFSAPIDGRQPEQITVGETNCFVQDIAPDGSEILYSSSKEDSVLWEVNTSQIRERSTISNINFNLWPAVSPDGKTLAFQSINSVSQGDKLFSGSIMLCSINQAGIELDQRQITTNAFMPTWSPDGKQLAFMRWSGGKFSLWTVMMDSKKETLLKASGVFPVEYTIFPYNRLETAYISWSPDSNKVAYVSDENGKMNIRTVMPNGLADLQLTNNIDSETEIFCPLWASSGNRLTYASKQKKEGKLTYEIHVIDPETKISRSVWESHSFLRLLGWSEMDKELILAVAPNENASLPPDIEIVQVSVETGDQRVLKKLKAAYPHNIHLSGNGKTLAFTSHRDGRDDLWIANVTGNEIKKLTANNDPRLYFSSLAWSSDGQTICFGKQSRYSLLSILTNFK